MSKKGFFAIFSEELVFCNQKYTEHGKYLLKLLRLFSLN